MFDIGIQELVIIFVVALLVFGPNKLPEVGRTLAKWVVEIRKGVQIAKVQMEKEFKETGAKPEDDITSYIPKELKDAQDIADEKKPEEGNAKENIIGKS